MLVKKSKISRVHQGERYLLLHNVEVKMERHFKVLSLKETLNEDSGLPKFSFEETVLEELIGNGSFGEVFKATYRGDTVVIKKLLAGSGSYKGLLKEAKLLHAVKGHQDIVDFFASDHLQSCRNTSVSLSTCLEKRSQ